MKENEIAAIYNREFFQWSIKSEVGSSLGFAKIVCKYMKPKSIVDVGCGCGIYLKAFSLLGIKDLLGFDGSEHAIECSLVPGKIKLHDLRVPLYTKRKFDLCLCMEVAEHIDVAYSEILADALIRLSDRLLFTAALPGQGGRNHVNEQPHDFWTALFQRKGFNFKKELTKRLRQEMKAKKVIWWIPQNLMVFERIKSK